MQDVSLDFGELSNPHLFDVNEDGLMDLLVTYKYYNEDSPINYLTYENPFLNQDRGFGLTKNILLGNDHNLLIGKVTSKAYHKKDETSPYSIRKNGMK